MSGAPSTATEPASNGHRRQNRKDFSGILGRLRRRGGLDVEAFVDEVLVELAAMEADGTKPTRSGPKPALTGAALRKAIMAIWCLCSQASPHFEKTQVTAQVPQPIDKWMYFSGQSIQESHFGPASRPISVLEGIGDPRAIGRSTHFPNPGR